MQTHADENTLGALRVLLADDAQIILDRLTIALNRIPGVEVVGCSRDSESAIQAIVAHRPNLVILDSRMGNSNGWDVLQYIERHHLNLPVFVFTNDSSEPQKSHFLAGGARKFFDKSLEINELGAAVRKLAARS